MLHHVTQGLHGLHTASQSNDGAARGSKILSQELVFYGPDMCRVKLLGEFEGHSAPVSGACTTIGGSHNQH